MNKKATKFSPEVRERAARLVREQRSEHPSMWAAVESITPMIGCTPQTSFLRDFRARTVQCPSQQQKALRLPEGSHSLATA